jgi:hypothetical protein
VDRDVEPVGALWRAVAPPASGYPGSPLHRVSLSARDAVESIYAHDEAAVAGAERALEGAGRRELKGPARDVVETQRREIDRMRRWRSGWYGARPGW